MSLVLLCAALFALFAPRLSEESEVRTIVELEPFLKHAMDESAGCWMTWLWMLVWTVMKSTVVGDA